MCRCCLFRPRPIAEEVCKIPLISLSFNAVVQNSIANLSITQVFQNQEVKPIECDYSFKQPEDSVTTSLKIYLANGDVLTAHVEPADEALESYQDNIAQGNTVALAKVEDDEKMTLLIGNLAPGESVKVEFNLVFPLVADESFWKLSFPANFLPNSGLSKSLNFDFSVQVISISPITDFSSNCNLAFEQSPDLLLLDGKVDTNSFTKFNDKHFWLKFKSQDTNTPTCLIEQFGTKTVAMLSLIPFTNEASNLDDMEGRGEFLFVIDRSGSMSGDRIETAKQAAILFLNSLPSGSLFNIISFGTRYEFLNNKSNPNTSANVKRAVERISLFAADFGGTDIYSPLCEIFRQQVDLDYPRTIFLLTDGQVGNTQQVISLIESNSGKARVNGFGIGEDVDTGLIKNSAKAGRGSASFVTDSSQIGPKVISALRKCIMPCIHSWSISLKGESYPDTSKFGHVYYGERCIQFILLDEKPSQPFQVVYFDGYKNETKEFIVSHFKEVQGDSIAKLWTKAKLDNLLLNSEMNEIEIKSISIQSGIPTTLTSLVCVIENENPVSGEMATRKVAKRVVDPRGYRLNKMIPAKRSLRSKQALLCSYAEKSMNVDRSIASATLSKGPGAIKSIGNMKMNASRCAMVEKKQMPMKEFASSGMAKMKKSISTESCAKSESIKERRDTGGNANQDYLFIVSRIESEGFWRYLDFKDRFPQINLVPGDLVDGKEKNDIVCTLFMIALLRKNFVDKFDEWVLLERKALRWLQKVVVQANEKIDIVMNLI